MAVQKFHPGCHILGEQERTAFSYELAGVDVVSPMEVYPGASVVSIGDDPFSMDILGDELIAISELNSKDVGFISEQPGELL